MEKNWFHWDKNKQEILVSLPGKEALKITKNHLEVSGFSGGPGGQNVNRNMNGVRLIYKIPEAYLISSRRTKELVARSINERSREQDLKEAFEDLAHKIERYFYQPPVRKKTKISKNSKRKRFNEKKKHAQIKENRKKVDF